jgi:hypothetical protein
VVVDIFDFRSVRDSSVPMSIGCHDGFLAALGGVP